MYLEALVIGLFIGYIRKGRLSNLLNAKFKAWYLAVLSLLFFIIPFIMIFMNFNYNRMEIFPFISLLLCFLIVLLNIKRPGMKIVIIGLILNILVISVSEFRMPIDTNALDSLGKTEFADSIRSDSVINYKDLNNFEANDRLAEVLGKVIKTPEIYPLSTVVSIGDILVSLGMIILIQNSMLFVKKRGISEFIFMPNSGR